MLSFWTKSNPEDVWDLHSTDLLVFPLHVVAHYSITFWWTLLVFYTAIRNGRNFGKCGSSLHLYIGVYVPSGRAWPRTRGTSVASGQAGSAEQIPAPPPAAQRGNSSSQCSRVQRSRHQSLLGEDCWKEAPCPGTSGSHRGCVCGSSLLPSAWPGLHLCCNSIPGRALCIPHLQ